MKTKTIAIVFILTLCSCKAKSQTIKGLSISLINESISFPFTQFTPIHPGAEFSVTIAEKITDKSIRNWNIGIGGYHHERLENGIYLRGEYVYRPLIKSVLSFDLIGGLGYMHTFYPGDVYELNSSNGEYEKIKQLGRAHAIATLGFGLTYIQSDKIQPFVRQEIIFESPFGNGIPVIFHSFVKLGINFKL